LEDLGDVPVMGEIRLCHAIDERLRRIVGDETNGELFRDEASGSGASGQHVEQFAAFLFTMLFDFFAETFLAPARGGSRRT